MERVMPLRSGPGLSYEDRHRKIGLPSWASQDGVVEDTGAWQAAPGLNLDYDRVNELPNHHDIIRQILGNGVWEDKMTYNRKMIKDSPHLFTPGILN